MATCKDCLHYEACNAHYSNIDIADIPDDIECKYFTDRTEWMHLPCKVGDRVYSINVGDEKTLKIWIEPNGDKITQININSGGYHFKCWWGYFHLSDIGKTVFLTREEAEKALKERERE